MPSTKLVLGIDTHVHLREFEEGDAEEIFALIDRNREHLSQNGDTTAGKYPTFESVLESITYPVDPVKIRLGIWDDGVFVGSVNVNYQPLKWLAS
jgi:hypothetical protein